MITDLMTGFLCGVVVATGFCHLVFYRVNDI